MFEHKDKWSVGEWMSRDLRTVSPNTSVKSAFFSMRLENIRHMLVVDEDNKKLLGIVSDRDLRRPDLTDEPDGWDEFYVLDDEYEVQDIMTVDLITVTPKDSIEKAIKIFLDYKFNALPVLDKNSDLIGILSSYDLQRAFLHQIKYLKDNHIKIN